MKNFPYTCGSCKWNEDLFCDAKGILVDDDEEGCSGYANDDITNKTGQKPGDPERKPYRIDL